MFSHTFSADPFPSGIETPDLIRNTFTYVDDVECEVTKNLDLWGGFGAFDEKHILIAVELWTGEIRVDCIYPDLPRGDCWAGHDLASRINSQTPDRITKGEWEYASPEGCKRCIMWESVGWTR